MWSLLPRNYQVLIILAAGMVIAWVLSTLYGLVLGEHPTAFKILSLTVMIVVVVLVALADRIWPILWQRFPLLQKKLFPDLNGVWKGELLST